MTHPDEGWPCYRHPTRMTLIRCIRCDRPICPDCMRPASVGFHCPDDVSGAARTVRQPRTHFGALLRESPPYVTYALIAANIAVYLATGLQHNATLTDPTGSSLLQRLWLVPTAIHGQHQYYRLLTSMFVHLSLLHIASNMLALAIIGPLLEGPLGRWRFSAVYFITGLGGSATVYTLGGHINATAGASGAIFGLFGTALVLGRRAGIDLRWILTVIVLDFVFTFSISGISIEGHIGGFVSGLIAGVAIGGWPTAPARLPARLQAGGLVGLLVLVAALVGVGTATW